MTEEFISIKCCEDWYEKLFQKLEEEFVETSWEIKNTL